MDSYTVKLYSRAYQDLDGIYSYIARDLSEPATALALVDALEQSILSLDRLPYRGALRRSGIYADRNYRQLFVKNYVIIYRVLDDEKEVHIITVQHSRKNL